jgi:hypothetical protein
MLLDKSKLQMGVFTQTCQMYRFVVHNFSKTIYNQKLTHSRKTREKARFRGFLFAERSIT